jgi:hypothetical protein
MFYYGYTARLGVGAVLDISIDSRCLSTGHPWGVDIDIGIAPCSRARCSLTPGDLWSIYIALLPGEGTGLLPAAVVALPSPAPPQAPMHRHRHRHTSTTLARVAIGPIGRHAWHRMVWRPSELGVLANRQASLSYPEGEKASRRTPTFGNFPRKKLTR